MEDNDELIGAAAARLIGISPQRLSKLAKDGKIPSRFIATTVRVYRRADVLAYANTPKSRGGRPKELAGTLVAVTPA